MAEYIGKDQVIEWFRPYGHVDEGIPYYGLVTDIREMKTADVAPVVHGRWMHSRYDNFSEQFDRVKCSQCNHEAYAMAFYVVDGNYCPHCGAKMDGGADNG